MNLHQRALRVGIASLLCAISVRFVSSDLPGKIWQWLLSPDAAAFLIYTETGRDVRFSPSSEAFSPAFVETPPPFLPEPEIPVIPRFSDADMVGLPVLTLLLPVWVSPFHSFVVVDAASAPLPMPGLPLPPVALTVPPVISTTPAP